MPVDNEVDSVEFFPYHLLLDIDFMFTVYKPDEVPADRDDLFYWQSPMGLGDIHVAGNGLHRCNGPELIEHRKFDDISGMKDKVNTLKYFKHCPRKGWDNERDMGIG